jgi:hypothetical protein
MSTPTPIVYKTVHQITFAQLDPTTWRCSSRSQHDGPGLDQR